MTIERTLIILKPDAIMRGVAGEIITRFERAGLKIIGTKMLQPDVDQFHHHYETIGKLGSRRGEEVLNVSVEMMQQGPVIAMVLEGVEAISLVRKMVGPTEPKAAQPGTIRGDYAHISYGYADSQHAGIANLIHASGDESDAAQEIKHWFSDSELYEYEPLHARFTQPKKSK